MSADNPYYKQFISGSGPTKRRIGSGSKLFDTLMVFVKGFLLRLARQLRLSVGMK